MKILLAAINAKYIHSNLAVYSLRAYAVQERKEYRESVGIAEYTINQQVDEILMDLYARQPDVLCFSCYLWNIVYVEQLVREIGKVLPKTEIWLGGPEVSCHARKVLKRLPQVRGVMCGEGEETFLELADYYHGNVQSLREIDGIVYADPANMDFVVNPPRSVMDLNRVPFVYAPNLLSDSNPDHSAFSENEGSGQEDFPSAEDSMEHFCNKILYLSLIHI